MSGTETARTGRTAKGAATLTADDIAAAEIVDETGDPAEAAITELEKIEATRVDGVTVPANGFPILMLKSLPDSPDDGRPAWHAQAVALAKAVTAGGQVDEGPDIAGADKVLALLAQLIKWEADELAAGRLDESYDISVLLDAVCAVKCFRAREATGDVLSDDGTKGGYPDDDDMGKSGEPVEKRDFTAGQRRKSASAGHAMPDGSYPIENTGDLHNAIQAFGRAKNKAGVKAHIRRRAKALGATDQIPDSWSRPKAAKSAADAGSGDTGGTGGYADLGKLNELVDAAVTKALAGSQERIASLEEVNKALESKLAEVLARPMPGGPVMSVTKAPPGAVSEDNTAEAARLRALAERADTAQMRDGYLELARRAEGRDPSSVTT